MSTQDKLQQILKKFAAEVPGRLQELVEQFEKLPRDGNEAQSEVIAEIKNECHKLAGTAANFGMAETGQICGETERLIIRAGQGTAGDDWKAEVVSNLKKASQLAIAVLERDAADGITATAAAAPAHATEARPVEAPAPRKEQHSAGLTRILLVDDDEVFREYVKLIGKQRLVDVCACATTEEALQEAKTFSPDAAIIDVNLGQDKSFEIVRDLRDLPHCSNLPIAFISAAGHLEDRIAAAYAGAALFLDKPLEPEMLENAVHQLAALRQVGLPKLLIVDDDFVYGQMISEHFAAQHYQVHQTATAENILSEMDRVRPDLVLLDVNLPDSNGFEVCRIVRNSQRFQDIPLMIVSGTTTYEARLAAFGAGADDFIPKPVVLEELTVKVESKIERARLLRERHRTDTITGLLIRQAFLEDFRGMLDRGSTEGMPVSVIMLDIDNFKKVNDLGGHLIGDAALAGLGRVLRRSFSPNDLRGRWGGDELMVALYGHDKATAAEALTAVLHQFQAIEFHGDKGTPFHLTFSAGVAECPQEGTGAYDLIKLADKRLYKAKADGRGRVCAVD